MIPEEYKSIILCEDVRYEIGNKKSLIGVFSGNITISEMPANLQLAFYILYEAEPTNEKTNFHFRMLIGDKEIFDASMTVTLSKRYNQLVLPRGIFRVEEEGILTLTGSVNDSEPVELIRRDIKKGPTTPR